MSGDATATTLPLSAEVVRGLRAGDELTLSGAVVTGRDRACARLHQLLGVGEPVPVPLQDEVIYFVGPTPARPGATIGSAGPTTSSRLNRFLPAMFDAGLRGMIGKGFVDDAVKRAVESRPGVYLGAIGGTGALLAGRIRSAEVIAFPELMSEAMFRLELDAFPVVVLHDCEGGDLYVAVYEGGRAN